MRQYEEVMSSAISSQSGFSGNVIVSQPKRPT